MTTDLFGADVHSIIYDRRLVLLAMNRPDGEQWLARQRATNNPRIRAWLATHPAHAAALRKVS